MNPGARAFLVGALRRPLAYWIWAIAVTASLIGGYFLHPYLFALVVFVLAGLSIGVAIVGLGMATFGALADARAGLGIVAALTVSAVALGVAFAVLGTFNWA